jgi:hypothetical protein
MDQWPRSDSAKSEKASARASRSPTERQLLERLDGGGDEPALDPRNSGLGSARADRELLLRQPVTLARFAEQISRSHRMTISDQTFVFLETGARSHLKRGATGPMTRVWAGDGTRSASSARGVVTAGGSRLASLRSSWR